MAGRETKESTMAGREIKRIYDDRERDKKNLQWQGEIQRIHNDRGDTKSLQWQGDTKSLQWQGDTKSLQWQGERYKESTKAESLNTL